MIDRRGVMRGFAAAGLSVLCRPLVARAQRANLVTRPIPSTGEQIPACGLGTWITFNVGNDPQARDACTEVMRNFFAAGGRLIDASPMYGSCCRFTCCGVRLALPRCGR